MYKMYPWYLRGAPAAQRPLPPPPLPGRAKSALQSQIMTTSPPYAGRSLAQRTQGWYAARLIHPHSQPAPLPLSTNALPPPPPPLRRALSGPTDPGVVRGSFVLVGGGPRHWQEHAYAAGRGEEDGGGGRGGRDCTLMLQVGGGCVCRWGWGGASEAKGTEALVATTVCFACS